jgi:hypothetical protein
VQFAQSVGELHIILRLSIIGARLHIQVKDVKVLCEVQFVWATGKLAHLVPAPAEQKKNDAHHAMGTVIYLFENDKAR